MEYNFFVGILPNFDFSVSGWMFFAVVTLLMLVGASSLLYVFCKPKEFQTKIVVLMGYLFGGLIVFGVLGLVLFALTYFSCYAFITDFSKDY